MLAVPLQHRRWCVFDGFDKFFACYILKVFMIPVSIFLNFMCHHLKNLILFITTKFQSFNLYQNYLFWR
ncbi:hypothetical protein B7954_08220, partial [Vibrio cholerae]